MGMFTESPLESLMMEKPEDGRPKAKPLPPFPPVMLCHSCPYGRVRGCIGICLKKLLEMGKD